MSPDEFLKKMDVIAVYPVRTKIGAVLLPYFLQMFLDAQQEEPVVSFEGDAVNRPAHYNTGKIEVIDYIEDQKLDFCLGNAVKYISRSAHKGSEKQDLEKAIWYLKRKISSL